MQNRIDEKSLPGYDSLRKLIEKKLNITDMVKPSREKEHVMARTIFSVIQVKMMRNTTTSVGRYLNKDHSTIIFYLKKHADEYNLYMDYTEKLDEIIRIFNLKTQL